MKSWVTSLLCSALACRGAGELVQKQPLPILDDAHQGPSAANAKGLSHVTEELLLELEAAFTDAPAPIHQEGQVNLAT